jgi:NAD(P)-dependent dehydrogenase (short-subunit alcohol dehydrogenase family)
MARDLAPRHITVNAIAPGFFPTNMTRFIAEDEALLAQVLKGIPLGRMGKPEDMGALTIYLASRASDFMTGSVLTLDGGQLLGG